MRNAWPLQVSQPGSGRCDTRRGSRSPDTLCLRRAKSGVLRFRLRGLPRLVHAAFVLLWFASCSLGMPSTDGKLYEQPVARDDRQFQELWDGLRRCETSVFFERGVLSAPYLVRRAYKPVDTGKGYVVFDVDERLYGIEVVELLVPTTWAIVNLKVKGSLETVQRKLESKWNVTFAPSDRPDKFMLRLPNGSVYVFSDRQDHAFSHISCELESE